MSSKKPGSLATVLKSRWTERAVDLLLVPALLLYSLWLPPASMGVRLFSMDYPLITPDEGGIVTTVDGVRLDVPSGAVAKRSRLQVEALTSEDLGSLPVGSPAMLSASVGQSTGGIKPDSPEFLAIQSVPDGLIVHSPFYRVDVKGQLPESGKLTVPVPYSLATVEMADMYGWDGESWQWMPAQLTSDRMDLVAKLETVPQMFMVARQQTGITRYGAGLSSSDEIDAALELMPLSMLSVGGATIRDDGGVDVDPAALDRLGPSAAITLLTLTNLVNGVVRSDLVDNLIIDETRRSLHVRAIVDSVAGAPIAGLELDYGAVDPTLEVEFTSFVTELAGALHATGKDLTVRVDQPIPAGSSWDTQAYNWRALGSAADQIRIPALLEPTAYSEGGDMDALLAWATGEVERSKLDLLISADAHTMNGQQMGTLSYRDALDLFASDIRVDDADRMLLPGESVNLSLAALNRLALEFDPDAQVYWFTYGEPTQTVWLENAASVARKLQFASRHGLGGVVLDRALSDGNDREIAQVVQMIRDNQAPAEPHFAFIWTVADAQGKTVGQQVMPLTNPDWVWTAPNNPGDYIIRASVSDDGGQTDLGPVSQVNLQVPTPTFTPTATPTSTPTATPIPTDTPTPAPTPKPVAQVAAAPPRVGGYFGYGIQGALVTDTDHGRIFDHINGMGFNWVKQQVEWFRYNPAPGQYEWGPLDRIVDSANARGVNVLFSVVKAPSWARPPQDTDEGPPSDPNTYGTFMRELAARYKGRVKAYEIWNEQNLFYEWGGHGHKLSAARYMELLKVAYNAVKSVDPGAVVVSGALTPTGVNDGDTAIDDRAFLEQMYQNGLARYCDAVGAHPSGYNNPPDADWRNWGDASAPSFKGHPSFFFRGTMESYRNIMVKYGDGGKRIWPTEFGWATVEGLGVGPAAGYGYAGDNSEAEQAQFLVRAYQMGKAWGWVGPMFLWNLNFAPVAGNADEKAAFGIVRSNWSPRQAFVALRDMPK